jgi:hypothetical protein
VLPAAAAVRGLVDQPIDANPTRLKIFLELQNIHSTFIADFPMPALHRRCGEAQKRYLEIA